VVFERPATRRSRQQLVDGLRASGEAIGFRIAAATPTPTRHHLLRHVIGIERWGQRRLGSLQGVPLVMDGHQSYKPPADADWATLERDFAATRAHTVALAAQLPENRDARVPHNQFGDLTVNGWLLYLKGHADYETRKIL
jgi:hypothetical protein